MLTHSPDPDRRAEQTRTGWSDTETRRLITAYNRMLALQDAGKMGRAKGQTSKAVIVRTFIAEHAPARTKGSVEMKLMNLSAVREDLGLPIVEGYKPLPNMASSCREIASERWGS
jgi:hypothetical protein